MLFDGFLVLVDQNGNPVIGETTDTTYKGQGIAIKSFNLGGSSTLGQLQDLQGALAGLSELDPMERERKMKQLTRVLQRASQGEGGGESASGKKSGPLTGALRQAEKDQSDRETLKLIFTITKEVDVSSPDFFQAYCWSKAWAAPTAGAQDLRTYLRATIVLRKAGAGPGALPFLEFAFSEVNIDSYNLTVVSGGQPPEERIAFSFKTYEMTYRPQAATGRGVAPVITTWTLP